MTKLPFNYSFFGLFLLFILGISACQPEDTSLTVTGTVSSATGALEGAMVSNSNNTSTTTDNNGQYSMVVDKEDKLTFNADGYQSKEIAVNGQAVIDVVLDEDAWVASFSANNNSIKDPQFPSNSLIPSLSIPAPSATDPWFSTAPYAGAMALTFSNPWYDGWSFFSNLVQGNASSDALGTPGKPVLRVDDSWMSAQGNTINWSADTVYVLDSLVFVKSGQTLNIAAGTVVQGEAGVSALIIAQGAKIMAIGSPVFPIIFTYEGDQGNSAASKRGQWGGLVILGYASLNSSPGLTQLEGVDGSDLRGIYGGMNDSDNSGTLRYVSIRHGGAALANNNALGGLTLGAVGTGTTLEHIEVVSNEGDGVQWLGGTVNAKYLISSYCGDDALYYNEGYRGKNQFVIVYQDPTLGDFGGEHLGGTSPQTGTPYATPQFWNVTSVGRAGSQALVFKDNAGGQYHNSIFIDYSKGISIEDKRRQEQDSYQQFADGNLMIANSVFFNIGNNNTAPIFSIDYVQ